MVIPDVFEPRITAPWVGQAIVRFINAYLESGGFVYVT